MFKMSDDEKTITVYNYLADTREFIGISDCHIPAGTGLPAYCTDIPPPETTAGNIAVFDGVKNIWSLMEDHRGKAFFDIVTGGKFDITEPGPLPKNTTSIPPDGPYQKWNGKAWVKDEKAEQAAELAEATELKNSLIRVANDHIAPLQDAFDLDMATDSEKQRLIKWKKYRILLNRVDCSKPVWPEQPVQ